MNNSPNSRPVRKPMLTPAEYWKILGTNILAGLSTEEFWVLAGREKVDQLIAEFEQGGALDCCQDAGVMTQGAIAYVDICMYDLMKINQAHELVNHYGSVNNAQATAVLDPMAVGLPLAIAQVVECEKVQRNLNTKIATNTGWEMY